MNACRVPFSVARALAAFCNLCAVGVWCFGPDQRYTLAITLHCPKVLLSSVLLSSITIAKYPFTPFAGQGYGMRWNGMWWVGDAEGCGVR